MRKASLSAKEIPFHRDPGVSNFIFNVIADRNDDFLLNFARFLFLSHFSDF
jgi:hypothetical protein